jgi:hypothetical protein
MAGYRVEALTQVHVSKTTKEPAGTAQRTQLGMATVCRSPSSAIQSGTPSASYPRGSSTPLTACQKEPPPSGEVPVPS